MEGLLIPDCWKAVEDFNSEMNRMIEAGVLIDNRLMLQVMRVLYDRAENGNEVLGLDLMPCAAEIQRLEKIVGGD